MNASTDILPGRADVRTIGLVSSAHSLSHFYQLVLPPLFPLLHFEEGYTYTELGSLVALYYLLSGLVQPAAGFLVDRVGPRPVLYAGIVLCVVACAGYAAVDNYIQFVAMAVLGGIGNGVFHPADYTVLSRNVSEARVGKGFSFHAFGGYVGYAIAPITIISLATAVGWREALLIAGLAGAVFLVFLITFGHSHIQTRNESDETVPQDAKSHAALLLTPTIIGCFLFFCAAAMAQIGLQTFAPAALFNLYQTAVTVSTAGITVFLVAVTLGILSGGVLADRTKRHHLVAIVCLIPPAVLVVLPAWFELTAVELWSMLAVIGFVFGLLIPSRDMIVRAAAPRHSSGKVFGVVYSGLDVGSALTPIAFGWVLDNDLAAWVFIAVGACFAIGIIAILLSRVGSPDGAKHT